MSVAVDFNLSPSQIERQRQAQALAGQLPANAGADTIVSEAARAGLVDSGGDLLAAVSKDTRQRAVCRAARLPERSRCRPTRFPP